MEHSADNPIPSGHSRFTTNEVHAEHLRSSLAATYGHVYEIIPANGGYYVSPVSGSSGK